ncbi:MAG: potassium channel family protein [Acidobacteriota bacterium]|nr:potassium channel family protein [Acidobacteriota bacterium]
MPRKIDRKFRVTRYYYLSTWRVYCFLSERVVHPKRRAAFLSIFGPLSLLGLFVVWGTSLVFAFALMNWAIQSSFKLPDGEALTFTLDLYVSGTTMTTLGLGDVTPRSPAARLVTVVEAGLGLGLVALVISYLPALYQAFSGREVEISLLDARAGSPPSATELLRRSARRGRPEGLEKLLADWERWCAEIMESHISYPVLCYFRSQHTNQSWVTAITAILDACALCITCLEHEASSQAHLTFAMGRHAVVDITQVFNRRPSSNMPERLSRESFQTICDDLRRSKLKVCPEEESWDRLSEMRRLYEPYLVTLSRHLRMDLAPWAHPLGMKDNWVTTKWEKRSESSRR